MNALLAQIDMLWNDFISEITQVLNKTFAQKETLTQS